MKKIKKEKNNYVITTNMFNTLLDKMQENQRKVFANKAKEYADLDNDDRMHNFKRAALQRNQTPESALFGMMLKHYICVLDMLDNIDKGKPCPTEEYVEEKLGDLRNYLVLLQVLITERRLKEKN